MKLYLASGNPHKVGEFQALASASLPDLEILSARAVGGMPAVEEDTGTFTGNARKKARALKQLLPDEMWVLADDSGLCVDALAGAPGVESAYFAGPAGNAAANLEKLIEVMRTVPVGRREARFVCVLVLLGPDGGEQVFEGSAIWSKPASAATGIDGDSLTLFGAESDGRVVAWRRADGERLWVSERLRFRGLSAPLVVGESIVIGDEVGTLHFLSRKDGAPVNRLSTDGSPVVSNLVLASKTVIAVTQRGGIFGFKPE